MPLPRSDSDATRVLYISSNVVLIALLQVAGGREDFRGGDRHATASTLQNPYITL